MLMDKPGANDGQNKSGKNARRERTRCPKSHPRPHLSYGTSAAHTGSLLLIIVGEQGQKSLQRSVVFNPFVFHSIT
jgi:hypothetical protein